MITQQQYDRLPFYVKEHLESLKRERDVAVRQLREYEDAQTPSDFWTEELICDEPGSPRTTKKYLQTYQVFMKVDGDEDHYLSLRRTLDGEVLLTTGWHGLQIIPRAYNQVKIEVTR